MAERALPFSAAAGGVKVSVRLAPRARDNRIVGIVAESDGSVALKVAVTAPPEGGKANAALVALLAREWRLPKSAFSVAAGAASRRKTVAIAGDARELVERLSEWARTKDGTDEHHRR